jgi:hypothetical protein
MPLAREEEAAAVPGRLSLKLVAVLAAFAFVIGFRIQADSGGSPDRTAATLSASGASALASDTTVQEAPRGIAAPALARVAALPALHRAPARPKRAVSKATPVTTATPVPTATATVVPSTPVVTTKPAAPKKKSYVGKTFDTKG